MNPQDADQIHEETLDDLGVLIVSESNCEEIKQILKIVKYFVIITILSCCIVVLIIFCNQ